MVLKVQCGRVLDFLFLDIWFSLLRLRFQQYGCEG